MNLLVASDRKHNSNWLKGGKKTGSSIVSGIVPNIAGFLSSSDVLRTCSLLCAGFSVRGSLQALAPATPPRSRQQKKASLPLCFWQTPGLHLDHVLPVSQSQGLEDGDHGWQAWVTCPQSRTLETVSGGREALQRKLEVLLSEAGARMTYKKK